MKVLSNSVRNTSRLESRTLGELRIRTAVAKDRSWIVPLAARLLEFGPPPWRAVDVMNRAVAAHLERALSEMKSDATILVAEGAAAEPLGFVYLHTAIDFFTGETHAHISDLAVRSTTEGLGVGSALLRAAQSWATCQQHRLLTLNVFSANQRARELYERMGFLCDTVKLVKELRVLG